MTPCTAPRTPPAPPKTPPAPSTAPRVPWASLGAADNKLKAPRHVTVTPAATMYSLPHTADGKRFRAVTVDLKDESGMDDSEIVGDPVSPEPFKLPDALAPDLQPPDVKQYHAGGKRCVVHDSSHVRKMPKFDQDPTSDYVESTHSLTTDQVALKKELENDETDEDDEELATLAFKAAPVDIEAAKQNTLVEVERIVGFKPLEAESQSTASLARARSPLSPSEVEAIIREYKDLLRNNGYGDGQAGDGSVNKYPRYMRMLFDDAVFISRAELFEKDALTKAVMFFTKLAFEKAKEGKTPAKKHFSNFMHGFTDFVELATP